MSFNQPEDSGFIAEHVFDQACQGLSRLALETGQRESKFDIRGEAQNRYLVISRPLSIGPSRQRSASPTASDSAEEAHDIPTDCADIEDEDDNAAVHHHPASHTSSTVEYQILYSTSYHVPVLYFFLRDMPAPKSRTIDTVYQYLVPQHLQTEARTVGVMGGIGMTNHPISDIPCFWVHPCNTAEAMKEILNSVERKSSPVEYLLIWVGIVGAAVGLSLPKEMIFGTDFK